MDIETLARQIHEICKTCSIRLEKESNTPANLGKTPAYVIAEMLLATIPKNTHFSSFLHSKSAPGNV